jgi:hypothetical protein
MGIRVSKVRKTFGDFLAIERDLHLFSGIGGREPRRSEFLMAIPDRHAGDEHLAVGRHVASAGQAFELALDLLGDLAELGKVFAVDVDRNRRGSAREDVRQSVLDGLADLHRHSGHTGGNRGDARANRGVVRFGLEEDVQFAVADRLGMLVAFRAPCSARHALDTIKCNEPLLEA